MSARRYAFFAALALFVAFVAANVIANSWFRSWRLDLTESRLYTLSPGTQRTLDDLTEPLQLTLYFSRDAARAEPALQAHAARVREILQTFQARSRGRVRFVEVDVQPFSEEADAADEAGMQAVRSPRAADPIYLGLTGANAIDDRAAIPYLDPQREPFLEYEITRLIYRLENPQRTRVALITSLPIDPAGADNPFTGARQWAFAADLGQMTDAVKLAPDFAEIPDVDVLAIIHPGALTPAQLYAVDQFILRRGRAFIALDPASAMARQASGLDAFGAMAPAPTSSSLEPLLGRWGVAMPPTVVLDRENALPVAVQDPMTGQTIDAPQPLVFAVPAEEDQLDREDLITARLARGLNFGLAGVLTTSTREGVTTHWLARTSGQTMRLPGDMALMQQLTPFDIDQMWPPTGGRVETVALRLSGVIETAFPNGPPAAAPPPAPEGAAGAEAAPPPAPPAAEPLARSATPAEIVIVADADFLADDFFFDPRNGTSFADNGAFALNAIDVLGGSDALVSLRSRSASVRRMELLDRMERDADRRIRGRQQELEADLQQTLGRLAELRARGGGSGFLSGELGAEVTAEANAEIDRFTQRVVEVRRELRNNARNLRGDINRLEAAVVFINVWLAPLLVAGAGLFLFWRRQRRVRGRR